MAATRFQLGLWITALAYGGAAGLAQSPSLSRSDRDDLQSLVSATDAAANHAETDAAAVRVHLMRASDGSHYVAYTVTPPAQSPLPAAPVALYVRLASAGAMASQRPERSMVREWLAGNQAAPPPAMSTQGIALGEMPIMGPSNVERRPPQTPEMANLTLIDLERRRAREKQDERERQRRSELEGRSTTSAETLPFEDFALNALPLAGSIQRALTAGPGDYFLYVAWVDRARPANPVVTKKRITLPPASPTEFTIGSVILADGLRARTTAYPPSEQAAHPYSIGLTEILPATGTTFPDDRPLSAVFQVINPQAGDAGKPDVDVLYELVRLNGTIEQPVAALTPQHYSGASLPPAFDLRAGHPLFATFTAPLQSVKSGNYRLKIFATDKIGGRTATTDVTFTVTATAAALLRDAPSLARPFQHNAVFAADVLPTVLAALRPAAPSEALQAAFDLAASGRFADLMVDAPVGPNEDGIRAALRGLAQLSLGDGSAAVQFQRAQLLGAPIGIARFLSGAARATQGQDADAIAAWLEALKAGAPRGLVTPPLLDAYLRRNDTARAAALIADAGPAWSRGVAATLIATQREPQAVLMLDARLAAAPDDADARWLLVHALFAQAVRQTSAAVQERFEQSARAYIDANGVNAALAREWLAALRK